MKLSLGQKLIGLFGIAAVLSIGAAYLTYRGTNEMLQTAGWVRHTSEVLENISEIRLSLTDAETGQRGFVITQNEKYLQPYTNAVERARAANRQFRALTLDNPIQTERADRIDDLITKKFTEMAEVIRLVNTHGFESGKKLVMTDLGKVIMDDLRSVLTSARSEEEGLMARREMERDRDVDQTKELLVAGIAVNLIFFFVMVFFVRNRIVDPLRKVVGMASGISAGNLKQEPLIVRSGDEIENLANVFNGMILSLRSLASQNIMVSKNLGNAASEVLSSIQEQAAAVRQQVASIQETTVTMDEIGQSGAQVAERAQQVSSTAQNTFDVSTTGISAVQDTNQTVIRIRTQVESLAEAILDLSERNQTIGEIISTVNDISEQSNLLAFNAAIEAVSAGESGQRFSVIANEIKNLADQAKTATSQVRTILSEIQKGINSSVLLTEEAVKRAETGKQHADVAEQTIRKLTDSTQESLRTFQQIVGATNQQRIGFDQITLALKGIRGGVEQTEISTNQLEKAALSMNALGQQLQKSVERYQI